jgi:hypothetical protein
MKHQITMSTLRVQDIADERWHGSQPRRSNLLITKTFEQGDPEPDHRADLISLVDTPQQSQHSVENGFPVHIQPENSYCILRWRQRRMPGMRRPFRTSRQSRPHQYTCERQPQDRAAGRSTLA